VALNEPSALGAVRNRLSSARASKIKQFATLGNPQRANFSRSRYGLMIETHLARYTKRPARFDGSNADLLMGALVIKLPALVLEVLIHFSQLHDRSAAAVAENGHQAKAVGVEFPAFVEGFG
jgi:hypothetical protein